jgi:Fe-S cluster biogenesis protein NfuA/nitrite reductase/ring-hydroxylating ferredoxin subunit
MRTPEQHFDEAAFQAATQHLDELVQRFDALPLPELRDQVFDLLQTVDAIHRMGLSHLVALLGQEGRAEFFERAADDPIVRTLLLLYDMLPSDEIDQVETALSMIRPYIHSHGGQIEVLGVADGVVHLRLSGACQGCAGQAMTLQRGIVAALREGFPGFQGIQVHEPEQRQRAEVIPLMIAAQEPTRSLRQPIFHSVAHVEELPDGTLRAFDVDGVRALVANVAGEFYAVRNSCPGSVAPLELGSFTPPVLICPWHNEAYDVRSGKRVDGEAGPGLAVLPVAVVDGKVQLAVNTSAS